MPGLTFQEEPEGHFSNRWLSCLTIESKLSGGVTRETVRLALASENIEARPLWKPMHLQPVFAGAPYFGEKGGGGLFAEGLCLPSGSNLGEEDLGRVVRGVRGCFG